MKKVTKTADARSHFIPYFLFRSESNSLTTNNARGARVISDGFD